jgi:hypothetical protein
MSGGITEANIPPIPALTISYLPQLQWRVCLPVFWHATDHLTSEIHRVTGVLIINSELVIVVDIDAMFLGGAVSCQLELPTND